MQLHHYLELLRVAEEDLAASLRTVGEAHAAEPDVQLTCELCAGWADAHVQALQPFEDRYADEAPDPPEELHADLFKGPREGGLGLLRDLHDVYLQATSCDMAWTLVGQAAKGARDEELIAAVGACEEETTRTLQWIQTRLKTSAPQALVVA